MNGNCGEIIPIFSTENAIFYSRYRTSSNLKREVWEDIFLVGLAFRPPENSDFRIQKPPNQGQFCGKVKQATNWSAQKPHFKRALRNTIWYFQELVWVSISLCLDKTARHPCNLDTFDYKPFLLSKTRDIQVKLRYDAPELHILVIDTITCLHHKNQYSIQNVYPLKILIRKSNPSEDIKIDPSRFVFYTQNRKKELKPK